MKKTVAILMVLVVCLLLGCGAEEAREKTISCEGLSITVPAQYQDLKELGYYSDFTYAFGYGEVEMVGRKIPLSLLDGWEPTLAEFARNFTYANNINARVIDQDGILTVYYESQADILWGHLAAFYEYDGGFWIVEYCCPADTYPVLELQFLQSLASVCISE